MTLLSTSVALRTRRASPAHAQDQHLHWDYPLTRSPVDLTVGLEHLWEALFIAEPAFDSTALGGIVSLRGQLEGHVGGVQWMGTLGRRSMRVFRQ